MTPVIFNRIINYEGRAVLERTRYIFRHLDPFYIMTGVAWAYHQWLPTGWTEESLIRLVANSACVLLTVPERGWSIFLFEIFNPDYFFFSLSEIFLRITVFIIHLRTSLPFHRGTAASTPLTEIPRIIQSYTFVRASSIHSHHLTVHGEGSRFIAGRLK